MTTPLPPAGPTAVRITGDHYQWLHVWNACLEVLRDHQTHTTPANPAIAVEVEATGVGNVDDVVVRRRTPPHTYSQVKYAANHQTPLGTPYLTIPSENAATNLIAKFADAHERLTSTGQPVDMCLLTNRVVDPASMLLTGLDPRTGLLTPNARKQGPTSRRGQERAAWAAAANITEPELLQLLDVLRFEVGQDLRNVKTNLVNLQAALGLRTDDNALLLATSWVAEQVRNGTRCLNRDDIENAVAALDLRAGRPWVSVSVATLKPDPLADQAIHAIDWVERFDGDNPYTRRRPKSPATWDEFADDLDNIEHAVNGHNAILVTGSLRLAAAFKLGTTLRGVTGTDVAWQQGSQTWHSDHPYDTPLTPTITDHAINQGDDTAFVLDVATTATPDVIEWVRRNDVPVKTLYSLTPPAGAPKDNSIPTPDAAVAYAVGIRNAVRRPARTSPNVHLFLACPLGLALILGHKWNRVATTSVYEDLNNAQGYERAFTVVA